MEVKHYENAVKKSLSKGMKAGAAEVNKKVKIESKNEQRKRDLAK